MRSLPILLPAAVIRARACPLASIRQIRTWRLRFVERSGNPTLDDLPRPAGWSDVVEASATPHGGAVALHGDGFRAVWDAPRPVTGPVRLRGDLVVDPLDGLETRGRILRLRLLTETVREDTAGERVVALTARDLSAIPKAVDDGSREAAGDTALDVRTRDRGVLLDVELGVA
ncbi:hypothetical protein [Actinomycetospora straminea]|uniref:HutD protein n=1 Tax=Actinomycetospora straminea TaxID=663607 RepID=A0ABP9F5Q2_9PSEU|nr:hypothetical protein [Actinomycetospora straminea]MDD7931708.1 hypothetical protein [Actinomycetospora straminea]